MAKKRDDEFYKIVKKHLGGPSDAERAERRMNEYNKQKQEAKEITVTKYTGDSKPSVHVKASKTNKNNTTQVHASSDLNELENNALNNYVSQHNYNDENVRVFNKERNQKKADELKSKLNDIVKQQSNQNRLAQLEVEESNLQKKDDSGNIVQPLGEDYEEINKNQSKKKQINAERQSIKSGYNTETNIDNSDLKSAWFVKNYKENLEKNAEESLHDENMYLNNQNAKVRNAVYDTLTQNTRDNIAKTQKVEAEERKKDMEIQGFDNYQDMVDYNNSWKGTISYIGRSALNSLAHFNKNVTTDVRDFLGIREELDDLGLGFLNSIADYYGDVADDDDEYLASKSKYVGSGTQLAGEGTKILAQMAPQIALAIVSGGTSSAISAGEAIGNVSTSAKVLSSLQTMAKQPTFWMSVIQEGGNAYEEAIQNGATQEQAQLSAIYTGLINGTIEMGGGLEDGAQKGLTKWLKSGNEEGLEEVKQDLVSGLISKSVYDNDKPLFSTTDDNAVLNPANELKAYAGGFFGGTVGAGIQQSAVSAYNKAKSSYLNKKMTKAFDNEIQADRTAEIIGRNTNESTNNSVDVSTNEVETPTVESVISEAETNQQTAKRITKILDKVDSGETVTDSEITEIKYNETASDMLGQMAGLKENKITSDLDNETVRTVINEAQNGKKNIDTVSILSNIRSKTKSTLNTASNINEIASSDVLTANEGNLTNTSQRALQDVAETSMPSQLSESTEAVTENIAGNAERNYINNTEADNLTVNQETSALNDSSYIEYVTNNDNIVHRISDNSNKILQLGISNEKTGSANIRKVESVDNGVAQLLMSNGEVVSADSIDYSGNTNAELILTTAGKYNSSTATVFIANYDSSKSPAQDYSTAFNSVYRMATTGLSIDEISQKAPGAKSLLGDKAFQAAIRAGQKTASGAFADTKKSEAKSKTTNKIKKTNEVSKTSESSSKTNTSNVNKNTAENVKSDSTSRIDVKTAAKEFSKALGVNINVYQSDSSRRGYYQNGDIYINESFVNKKANSSSEFNFILAHELTHFLEESKHYNSMKTYILNSRVYSDYLVINDTTHTQEIASRQELYEKYGETLTKEQAEQELIADFIADELLTNEESIRELAQTNRGLFVKVKEFLNNIIANLKKFATGSDSITKAQKDLIQIKSLYNKAFKDVKKNGTYSNEIKYSKKLGGYNPEINVTTDNVLKEYGIKNINAKYEVINKVASKLSKSYLSTNEMHKPITNIDTGLKIEIRKSGIRETFGNDKYYLNLSKELKLAKIASMSELAKMIKYGEVRAESAANYHNPNSKLRFSYLKSSINIDGVNYEVTMDIKMRPDSTNTFYVHNLKIKKQKINPQAHNVNLLSENLSSNNNIPQKNNIVNTNILKNSDNDTKFSISDEKEKWKPIKPSEKTQKVLDRLAEDKPVTLDLISELPEIAEAYARRGHINPTVNINTKEREQLRTDIQNEVEGLGSARLDNNGEWVYNGNIEQGHRVDIVIGLPAAGKSTVLANPLSETYNSRIVDSDVVKEKLPEYDNGYGADHVHEESKLINDKILDKAISKGENIVLPIIGSDYTKLVNKISKYKDKGYNVHLHLNELPMNKSLGRMLNRFLTDGRFIDPKISYKYQNKPSAVFDRVISTKGDLLDGYSKYSNDVERGQDPIFIKGTENIQEAYKGRDKGTTEGDSGDVRESGRDGGRVLQESVNSTEEKNAIDSNVREKVQSLNEKYGTKKKGENPTRNIDVPEKSSEKKRVREFVKTVLESDTLTDEMASEVNKELVKEALSYEPLSNENALKIAEEWADNKGQGITEKHWKDWSVLSSRSHKVTAIDIAKGELLLRSAAKSSDTLKVLQLTSDLAEMATTAGQTVQAMRLLKKSTGLGQLYYAEKTVRRMNADYEAKYAKQKRKGKEIPHIEINEDLALELAQAKTETEKELASDKLYKDIGEQVPSNWVDKWNAWRYMCMLTNPTTHIRNLVGNAIFMPAVACKNTISYGLETAFLRTGEKTKALKVKDEYKTFAEQDFDYVKDELTGNGKYEPTDMIQSNKIIYKNKFLEGARNLNSNLLEWEDGIFLKHHYKRAFSMYLQANKISLKTLSDAKAETARQTAIDKGRIYAIKEAQKATYRDASKISDAISQFAKSNKATGIIVEGVIPFKKTPVNILKRSVEYSPAGLIKTLSYDSVKLKKGEISASEYIDRLSSGITGTALTTLGWFLGSLGLMKVGLGDDDKEQSFESLKGHQEYSIELFGYSYTFDWACPAAVPMFVGAKVGELLQKDNEGLTFSDYQNLTNTMLDPVFEMSVLSGINNLISNVKYSESPVIDSGLYTVSSYLGQAVPTLGGKIANTIDGTTRSSYIDKSKDTFASRLLTSSQQQFVDKIIKKIPGATYLLSPYINEWGEQEKEDNIGVRIFENFISPGYISKIEVDEVEKMLDDTYKNSGDSAVLPTKSKKYFSLGGKTVNLTADEYTTYATVRGQMAHSILKDLSSNSDFKSADSSDKADLVSKSYELSNAIAKQGVSDYEPDGWIASAIEANEKGMNYAEYLVLREDLSQISGQGTKEKIYNKIRRMNISGKEKEALWLSFYNDMTLGGERIYFY